MGLNEGVSAERLHIGFFGLRNAGKSSLVNAVTGQALSLVSDVKGTTTDPVKKAMELLPLGPVVIVDTPGIDDEGELGEMRVMRAMETLGKTDIAVLVSEAGRELFPAEQKLIDSFNERKNPYIIARTKCDLLENVPENSEREVFVSAKNNAGINELKNTLGKLSGKAASARVLVQDLLEPNDVVVLVTPIDSAAPKGRLILPQQQTIRDILDAGAINVVVKETELEQALKMLKQPPKMVITDSQAFGKVSKIVPENIPLTSFSILFARYKGELETAVRGAAALDKLKSGDRVLIAEGCTHHRQCGDIGTVKLPAWLNNYAKGEIDCEFSSGGDFPNDLSRYAVIIHCGACMLTEREMHTRLEAAQNAGIPITNYGIAIAQMHGILKRSLSPFPKIAELLKG